MSPSDHSAATSKTAPAAVPPQSTAPTQSAERTAPNAARRRLTELLESPSTGIWIAPGVLFLLSWILQPQSVRQSALLGMLPFAGVLAIAAMGQTLVIQQGGMHLQ